VSHPQQYVDQPMERNHPPLLCNLMLWKSEKHKNRQRGSCTYEKITFHLLGMGLYSISANYNRDNSLSNGIINLESFFTNLDILASQTLGEKRKSHAGEGFNIYFNRDGQVQNIPKRLFLTNINFKSKMSNK
jgi:hypothetical protein